jgi:cytochrome c oxidase accessory protein FixG
MFDRDTMIIAYDAGRGEPRGSRKRSVDHKARGLGDCIDCTMCVQVCPTGIDIRDGLQYQCIGCAACIDACDAVMDKMEYPRGLIRFTTENAVLGKPVRVLRTRTVIYGSALLLLSAGVLAAVLMRTPLALDVLRDRNALYRETAQGLIENVYTLKVINMDEREHRYRVEIAGLPGATLILEHDDVRVGAGEVLAVPARVRVDPYDLEHASSSLTFLVKALDDPDLGAHQVARFLGPARRAAR